MDAYEEGSENFLGGNSLGSEFFEEYLLGSESKHPQFFYF